MKAGTQQTIWNVVANHLKLYLICQHWNHITQTLKPESIQHCLWPPDLHSMQLWVVTYLWPRFWDRQGLGNSSHGTLLSCGHMSGYWDSYTDTDTDSPKTQSGKLWDKIMGMNTWHKILWINHFAITEKVLNFTCYEYVLLFVPEELNPDDLIIIQFVK